jgi:hypothetical protein
MATWVCQSASTYSSRAEEARNRSSSVARYRHALETGGEWTVRLAELRSDPLGRIGDAGAGGNARRSVDIPPSLFQYRNFPLIRFDACAILRASAFHVIDHSFSLTAQATGLPFAGSCGCCVATVFVARFGIAGTANHRASDPAIGTISPAVSCLQEAGAHVLLLVGNC